MMRYVAILCLLAGMSMSAFAATDSMSMTWTSPDSYENGEALLPEQIDKYEITVTAPDGTVEVTEVIGDVNTYAQELTGGEGVYVVSIRVKDNKYKLWSDPVEVSVLVEDKVDNSASKIHFNIKIEITHNG